MALRTVILINQTTGLLSSGYFSGG